MFKAVFLFSVMAAQAWSQPILGENLAPFVPSPQVVVEKMLELAKVKPGEMVYDLGCGDGRVIITAAQKFDARATGIEIKESLVRSTLRKVSDLNLSSQVQVVHGDAMKTDLTNADVVTLYLLTKSNELFKPKFEQMLKPGARVVSYEYEIRGWEPSAVEVVDVNDRPHSIYLYEMPPKPSKKDSKSKD